MQFKNIIWNIKSFFSKLSKANIQIYKRKDLYFLLEKTSLVDWRFIRDGFWEDIQLGYLENIAKEMHAKHTLAFLDIGSYFGLYALLAFKWGYFENIHAFEADRHNFAQLQANLFLNNATHSIVAHHKAISDCTSILQFHDSRSHILKNRGGVGIVNEDSELEKYPVQATTIDACVHLDNAHVLIGKIDVEGHESKVLLGMAQTIKSNKVILQIEIAKEQEDETYQNIEKLGLRQFQQISHDHYVTNISPEELGF